MERRTVEFSVRISPQRQRKRNKTSTLNAMKPGSVRWSDSEAGIVQEGGGKRSDHGIAWTRDRGVEQGLCLRLHPCVCAPRFPPSGGGRDGWLRSQRRYLLGCDGDEGLEAMPPKLGDSYHYYYYYYYYYRYDCRRQSPVAYGACVNVMI